MNEAHVARGLDSGECKLIRKISFFFEQVPVFITARIARFAQLRRARTRLRDRLPLFLAKGHFFKTVFFNNSGWLSA